jgi:bifunctional DNA-binding transcriptional regulator/antitoxin component of YhaV-PrlF toxin-antitoxin module
MKRTISIRKIDEDYCLVLPKEAIALVGWQENQMLELRADETGIEIFDPKPVSDDEMERQMIAARQMMRKYHVALSKLAKE